MVSPYPNVKAPITVGRIRIVIIEVMAMINNTKKVRLFIDEKPQRLQVIIRYSKGINKSKIANIHDIGDKVLKKSLVQ